MNDVIERTQESSALPLIHDERYNLAICTNCHTGLPFDRIIKHMKESYGLKCNDNSILEFLNIIEPTMNANEIKIWLKQNHSLAHPIVQISVNDGFGCSLCDYSAMKKASIYNHISNKHRNAIEAGSIIERKVQMPFKGDLHQYIFVDSINEDVDDISDWRKALNDSFNQTINYYTVFPSTRSGQSRDAIVRRYRNGRN
jgi:hypothetical protein